MDDRYFDADEKDKKKVLNLVKIRELKNLKDIEDLKNLNGLGIDRIYHEPKINMMGADKPFIVRKGHVFNFEYNKYWIEFIERGFSNVNNKKKTYTLPRSVYLMCVHGALLVGSQAKRIMGENIDSHDYDLLIPFEKWQIIILMIPENAEPNKFGGWRFIDDKDNEIDVWPDTLQNYLANGKTKYGGSIYAIDYTKNKVYSSNTIIL